MTRENFLQKKSSSLLAPGQNCWRVQEAEKISFLVDGDSYFHAFREAVKLARKSVFICGWDIDSRLELLREDPEDGYPLHLGDFLNAVAARNRDLQIYILIWDFSMLVGMDREWFPIYSLDWKTHGNVHFAMDDQHPVGGSHHQKIVIVDDSLAFVGGLDLTVNRWDTPAHDPDDVRRRSFDGKAYRPHHDVQVLVKGETAADLGEFFRQRWQHVTGKNIAPRDVSDSVDIWPESLEPDIRDCRVGIARTIGAYDDVESVHEVEKLYLDTIEKARKYIYIENQYLTAPKIFKALAASLQKENGPEVIMVMPLSTDGWLSQHTMDVMRNRAMKELRRADEHCRLGIFYAHQDGLQNEDSIKIHAKVMIVDDIFVRVGSSNLNNRSMGLDTECDLALEVEDDSGRKEKVSRFCYRLLAEHLGVKSDEVHDTLDETGSLLQAVRRLQGNKRTLKYLDYTQHDDTVEFLAEEQYLWDPERPIEPEKLLEHWLPVEKLQDGGFNKIGLALFIIVGMGLALAWRFTPLSQIISGEHLSSVVHFLQASDLAWLYVSGAYIFGSILFVPIIVLITLTILIYGSYKGFVLAILGSCASGAITYWLGRILGRNTVRRLAGDRVNQLSRRLGKNGIFSSFIVHLLPIAPFSLVNIITGATHIRFRDFIVGTVMGLLPGILAIAGLIDRGSALFTNPGPLTISGFIAVTVVIAAGYFFLRQKLQDN
jgi:phospholipase D1/2